MKALLLSMPLLLAGCCGTCDKYWQSVEQGFFSNPKEHKRIFGQLKRVHPKQFKAVARVMVKRGSKETVFTAFAKMNREKLELDLAGLNDLGNVIFKLRWSDTGGTKVLKNRSGWNDDVLCGTVLRDFLQIYTPKPLENHIIETEVGSQITHKARLSDGSIDEYRFTMTGTKWSGFKRRSFILWGEVSHQYSIVPNAWKSLPGLKNEVPTQYQIHDQQLDYEASIKVTKLQSLE